MYTVRPPQDSLKVAFCSSAEGYIFSQREHFIFFPLVKKTKHCSCLLFLQLLASDGVQQSIPVTVTITVLDANDNTPTFANVSYNVNLFTDMMSGETVLKVRTEKHTNKKSSYRTRGMFLVIYFRVFVYLSPARSSRLRCRSQRSDHLPDLSWRPGTFCYWQQVNIFYS